MVFIKQHGQNDKQGPFLKRFYRFFSKGPVFFIGILGLGLVGCHQGNPVFMKPPINSPSDDATIKLAQAASSVSKSMLQMAEVEKVVIPQGLDNVLTIPNSPALQTRASVDWSGPIEELTRRIAKAANYRLRILGPEPSLPVLISLNAKDESLAEILRNIDYQAGTKASLYVDPRHDLVELRYAKIYT